MMVSNLFEMIQCLQYGTKLHIGVLFLNGYGNEMCQLPYHHTIHSGEVCDEMKGKGKQAFKRCFRCRNLAIQKALLTREPFGGICINGVYEYTHPVIIGDEVVCIIYIGNILEQGRGRKRLEKQLGDHGELISTLEETFPYQKCAEFGKLVESYIRFLLETYGYRKKTENPLIDNIKNYLLTNLEYDIDISHITAIFHYNQQYLGRLFKKETGLSIREYVLQQRLERAKLLLEDTNDTVIGIANRVGFNNITYFNRQFKSRYGITPSRSRSGNKKRYGE